MKTILTMRLAPPLHLSRPEPLSSRPPSREEQLQELKQMEATERKPVTYVFMDIDSTYAACSALLRCVLQHNAFRHIHGHQKHPQPPFSGIH